MNAAAKRKLLLAGVLTGLYLFSAITVLLLFQDGFLEISMLAKSLMAGGIVTGLYLPMLAWLYLRPASLKRYSGFPLEELELNEEDLSEAISNWVYAKKKRRMEGRIQLLEDDAKNVICRVTVRKD